MKKSLVFTFAFIFTSIFSTIGFTANALTNQLYPARNIPLFNIKAAVNNKYVCSHNNGRDKIIAHSSSVGIWEKFSIITNGDNTISIKSYANGKYITVEQSGSNLLIANRSIVGPWEKFSLVANNDNTYSFKSIGNGKYVSAEHAGTLPLMAKRPSIGTWEKFKLATFTIEVGLEPDAIISDFNQGKVGDCWFLSSLRAYTNDIDGADQIRNAIRRIDNNTWSVNFPGVQGNVTRTELNTYQINGKTLSTLDADTRLIEIAIHKYSRDRGVIFGGTVDSGGNAVWAFHLLNGRVNLERERGVVTSFIGNRLKRAYDDGRADGICMVFDSNAKSNALNYPKNHAGMILELDYSTGTFYYINPWNSAKILTGKIDTLISCIKNNTINVRYGKV